MAAGDIVPVPGAQFEETLAAASPDLLREMIKGFAQRMMDADVEVRCNAGYGEVTPERVKVQVSDHASAASMTSADAGAEYATHKSYGPLRADVSSSLLTLTDP